MLDIVKSSIGTKFARQWSDMICGIAVEAVNTVSIDANGRKEVDTLSATLRSRSDTSGGQSDTSRHESDSSGEEADVSRESSATSIVRADPTTPRNGRVHDGHDRTRAQLAEAKRQATNAKQRVRDQTRRDEWDRLLTRSEIVLKQFLERPSAPHTDTPHPKTRLRPPAYP
eukprot:CFRG1327T1